MPSSQSLEHERPATTVDEQNAVDDTDDRGRFMLVAQPVRVADDDTLAREITEVPNFLPSA